MGLHEIVGEQIYTNLISFEVLTLIISDQNRLMLLPREISIACARVFQDTHSPPPHMLPGYVWKSHWQSSKSLLLIMMSDPVLSGNDCSASKFQNPIIVTQNLNMTTELI